MDGIHFYRSPNYGYPAAGYTRRRRRYYRSLRFTAVPSTSRQLRPYRHHRTLISRRGGPEKNLPFGSAPRARDRTRGTLFPGSASSYNCCTRRCIQNDMRLLHRESNSRTFDGIARKAATAVVVAGAVTEQSPRGIGVL